MRNTVFPLYSYRDTLTMAFSYVRCNKRCIFNLCGAIISEKTKPRILRIALGLLYIYIGLKCLNYQSKVIRFNPKTFLFLDILFQPSKFLCRSLSRLLFLCLRFLLLWLVRHLLRLKLLRLFSHSFELGLRFSIL